MPTHISTPAHPVSQHCNPFLLKVMVFSPESGFKFNVEVQLSCTASNHEVWRLLFNLAEKQGSDFVDIVAVEFTAGEADEKIGVQKMATSGVTRPQLEALSTDSYPKAKALADGHDPTEEEQTALHQSLRRVVVHG